MKKPDYIIFADGGARNNPGPAAIGFVIQDLRGQTLKAMGERIENTTNNVAEYQAIIAALKKLKALAGGDGAKRASVEVRMDSELVIRQINAEYKIREPQLQLLFVKLWNLKQDFDSILFKYVPREENREADRLVNETLDREQRGLAI